MFGLGAQEIIILLVVGLMLVGGPTLAIVVALSFARNSAGNAQRDPVADLRAEVRQLREEVERLKKGSA